MIIILVALTFFGAILVGAIIRHRAEKREVLRVGAERSWTACPVVVHPHRNPFIIPKEELALGRATISPVAVAPDPGRVSQFPKEVYYHDGHTWAKLEEGDRVRVGLDDFTQQVMGDIHNIEIPRVGTQLNQGEVAWKLCHGKRKLNQLAPLGGTVVEVNEKLRKDPSLANRSPYEEGWVLKIQSKALGEEIPKLMDSFQFQMHFDQIKAKLISSFNHETVGRVYGDGGAVVKGAAAKLDDRLWKILITQLFHSTPD